MSRKFVELNLRCDFVNTKILVTELTLETYVSTENMLPDKSGVVPASSLPNVKSVSMYQSGDVLTSNIRPYFKKIWIANKTGGASNDVLIFRAKREYDSVFLYYVLANDEFFAYSTKSSKGTKMPRGDKDAIMQYLVPDISFGEQQKIASVLSTYDHLIENNNRRIAILEEMAQKLYREWFVHFRFPGHENVKMVESEMGLIPEGWRIKALADIANITMGQSPKSEYYNEKCEGLPFHQGVTNFNKLIPEHKMYSTDGSRIANDGDILFSVRAPVGRINLANCQLVLGRGLSSIRHKQNHQAYLLFSLRTLFDKLDLIGSGSIFNSVTKEDMHSIKVLTASQSIEIQFESLAKPVVNQLITLNEKNTNLRKTRDLLLPRLISGDIDVSELDIPIKEG